MTERLKVVDRHGFTLVELALVLVIVGLLITGILRGEALIQNARMRSLLNQRDTFTAACFTFMDRFGQFPGDEALGTAGGTGAIPTSDTNNGNNNGQIAGLEQWYLFQDLALAGIVNGNFTGAANSAPNNPFGGMLTIVYVGTPAGTGQTVMNANCIVNTLVPSEIAQQIDLRYDDGVDTTGTIRSNTAYTSTAAKTLSWRLQ
jgi:prepilin-type N-terminal cleavage/methylation domain-containing protein